MGRGRTFFETVRAVEGGRRGRGEAEVKWNFRARGCEVQ